MGLSSDDRLRELRHAKPEDAWWGFIVYRTSYSDDKAWQAFKAKFEQYRIKQVTAEEINALGRRSPQDIRLVQNSLRLVYVEDPSLENADDTSIRKRFMRHCQAHGWSSGTRGRNQVCLKIDEDSMQSVVTKPAPADSDWDNRYTVSEPDPEDADRIIVKQTEIETAYVNVVERHYDNVPAGLEPAKESTESAPNAEEDEEGGGEEEEEKEEERLYPIKVAISDVLGGFYSNLLSDLRLDELSLSPKTGIYSSIGMMTRYRRERDDDESAHGNRRRLPTRLPVVGATPTRAPQVDAAGPSNGEQKQGTFNTPVISTAPGVELSTHVDERRDLDKLLREVLYCRHKVQKALLSRDTTLAASDMPEVNRFFETIEAKGELPAPVLQQTRIHKVMKIVARLERIPRDDEFKFQERASAMYERWHQTLNDPSTT